MINNYEHHELLEFVPESTREEKRELKEAIEITGQVDAIFLYEGKIIDGRARQDVCNQLGIKLHTMNILKGRSHGFVSEYITEKNFGKRQQIPKTRRTHGSEQEAERNITLR
jgi:hypothetical protein